MIYLRIKIGQIDYDESGGDDQAQAAFDVIVADFVGQRFRAQIDFGAWRGPSALPKQKPPGIQRIPGGQHHRVYRVADPRCGYNQSNENETNPIPIGRTGDAASQALTIQANASSNASTIR